MSPVPARIIVVMGVASSGKTVVGAELARRLHAPLLDGDDFHPAANKDKMRAGIPLVDEDRWPWLSNLAKSLHEAAGLKGVAIGACSALKRNYRDYLIAEAGEPILFAYLDGSKELIASRIAVRHHEYMPASLLDSQFATLEVPAADENAVVVPIVDAVDKVAERIVKAVPHLKAFKRGQ